MASLSKGILKSSGFIDINPRLAAVAIYLFNDISMIFFSIRLLMKAGIPMWVFLSLHST